MILHSSLPVEGDEKFFDSKILNSIQSITVELQKMFVEEFSAKNSYFSAPPKQKSFTDCCFVEYEFVVITGIDEHLQNNLRFKVSIENFSLNASAYSFSTFLWTEIKCKTKPDKLTYSDIEIRTPLLKPYKSTTQKNLKQYLNYLATPTVLTNQRAEFFHAAQSHKFKILEELTP